MNLSRSFWILLTYASKNSIILAYLILLIDSAFNDILRIVLINSSINLCGLSVHKNVGFTSYSSTFENIETDTGTCSDIICNYFVSSLDSIFFNNASKSKTHSYG